MEKAQDLGIFLRKMTKKLILIDMNGLEYNVVDKKKFIDHILNHHSNGISIHEENGFFFKVDNIFRKKIKSFKT